MFRVLASLLRWWDRQEWLAEVIGVYGLVLIPSLFVAFLCQVTLLGGAAVIALLITVGYMLRSPR